MAWHIGNLTAAASVGKLPKLEKYLKRDEAKPKTIGQQRSALAMLGEFLGKPLGKTHLKRRNKAKGNT